MELLIHSEDIERRVALARELGHAEVIILHTRHDKENAPVEGTTTALLVSTTNQAKALKRAYDRIVAPCKREFFESRYVDYILEPESGKRGDFLHHRNSGLNQVLLKLCQATSKRPAKGIITTSALLLRSGRPEQVIGRMAQNARWCRKYKIPYHVTSGARTRWEQRDRACLDALRRELERG